MTITAKHVLSIRILDEIFVPSCPNLELVQNVLDDNGSRPKCFGPSSIFEIAKKNHPTKYVPWSRFACHKFRPACRILTT